MGRLGRSTPLVSRPNNLQKLVDHVIETQREWDSQPVGEHWRVYAYTRHINAVPNWKDYLHASDFARDHSVKF